MATSSAPPVATLVHGLLRVATCGSVDDGKSTLLGRLLHDTRQIADDRASEAAMEDRKKAGYF